MTCSSIYVLDQSKLFALFSSFSSRANFFHVIAIVTFNEVFELDISSMSIQRRRMRDLQAILMFIFYQTSLRKETRYADAILCSDSLFVKTEVFRLFHQVIACKSCNDVVYEILFILTRKRFRESHAI